MMSGEIIKSRTLNFGFALGSMKHAINASTTLNERLKQAGIKDSTPKEEVKGSKNKNSKKKKKQFKKSYSEDYMNNCFQRSKKLRKPLKQYVAPLTPDKSFNEEDFRWKLLSPASEGLSQNRAEDVAASEKETIFVSLDFLEDLQNYRRKVRRPKDGVRLKNRGSTVRSAPVVRKPEKKRREAKKPETDFGKDARAVQDTETRDAQKETPVKAEKEACDTVMKSKTGKALIENFQIVQPLMEKLSSEDIAKIDKKYLNSLLSVTVKKEERETKRPTSEDNSGALERENQSEKRNKLTGKDYFEKKTRTKELKDEKLKNSEDTLTPGKGGKKGAAHSRATATATRTVRDSTKSEEQIKLKKGKNLFENKNKPQKKNVTLSKPDIKDNDRKKRKQRNKCQRNDAEEFIEKCLPSEVSKVADVKEIWRKKSESSMTSHSSTTVQGVAHEEYQISKNFDSYRHLKRLVEEEISHISKKKADGQPNAKKDNNKTSASPKQTEQPKTATAAASEKLDKLPILKRRLLQAGQEGKSQKFQPASILAEDIPKEASPQMAKLEETAKEGAKIPSKVIENWSILNRLEQAFLALGTPTFPDKNIKNLTTFRGKHVTEQSGDAQKLQASHLKKPQKCKDAPEKRNNKLPENHAASSQKTKESQGKSVKKSEAPMVTTLKEKHHVTKCRKGPEQGTLEINFAKVSKASENLSKQKKKKRQIRPDVSASSKKYVTSVLKAPKAEGQDGRLTSNRVVSRRHKETRSESSRPGQPIRNQKSNSEDNLERKKTFDVIPAADSSTFKPQQRETSGLEGRKHRGASSKEKQSIKSESDVANPEKSADEESAQSWKTASLDGNHESTTTLQGGNIKEEVKKEANAEETPEKAPSGPEDKFDNNSNGSYTDTTSRLNAGCEGKKETPKTKANWDVTIDATKNMSFELISAKKDKSLEILNGNINRDKTKNIWNILIGCNKGMNVEVNKSPSTTTATITRDKTNSHDSISSGNKHHERETTVDTNNGVKERAVKKRSFLSVHVNQHCDQVPRKLLQITEKENSGSSIEKVHADFQVVKRSFSNASVISTGTYDVVDTSIQNYFINKSCQQPSMKPGGKVDISPRLTLSSINNSEFSMDENVEVEQDRGESKNARQQPLWEQDIAHYRAIVKDIMSQYKRIDGFLKQNEELTHVYDESSSALITDESGKSFSEDDARTMSIHEYRRKIASEYKELPILEYKKKLRQENEKNSSDGGRKRNLIVVNNLRTGADVDVKDFQPNVQNILDSPLYVDTERKAGRNNLNIKFNEKRSSLQEVALTKRDRRCDSEEWQRSSSTPKSFPPQRSYLIRTSAQTLLSENSLNDSCTTSDSRMGSAQETESDSFHESQPFLSSNAERQVPWKVQ